MIYHPALSYFARDYGLHQISIEEGGKEPSPAHLKELIDLCKAEDVRVIFVQPEFDKRNAETIAQQTGTKVVPINPLSYDWETEMLNVAKALAPAETKEQTVSQTVISEKPMTKPIIEIKNLSAGYDGRNVLHDINLAVYERDFLGIIGPNGGGKTTLIKCILGLLKPTGGEISFNCKPSLGYLPQYSTIDRKFPISVEEVILSGLSIQKSRPPVSPPNKRRRASKLLPAWGSKDSNTVLSGN